MLDPAVVPVLDAIRSAARLDQMGVQAARELAEGRPRPVVTPVHSVRDVTTPDGLDLRIYAPTDGPLPVIVFAHGGGWILGSIATADETCRRMAESSGCAVVSVGYRLAPEHPHPAAVHDLVDALSWVVDCGVGEGFRADQVYLAGESSGAHVALTAALTADAPPLNGLLLVCPPVDPGMDTPSWQELGEGYQPERPQMAWMWDLYLGAGREHARGAPDPATADLAGLPPTVVVAAEFDPLRDEALHLCRRLESAGVTTTVIVARGQIHPVFAQAPLVPAADDYLRRASKALVLGYLPSNKPNVAEQVAEYERSGGQRANTIGEGSWPIVVITSRGAKSGALRKNPVIRVERDGVYAAVASLGGAPTNPSWYHNFLHDPEVMLQDGAEGLPFHARLVSGAERAEWWEYAVSVYPLYRDYQELTDRLIPIFVLEASEARSR